MLLFTQDTVTSSCVTTSLGSTTAHLIPTIRLKHDSRRGPTLFPVDVDAICKCWGGVRASVQLVSALLCSVTRYCNEHDDVSKYWEDVTRYPVLKLNSCDLGVLTALGYGHVNMQPNLHFNVTVAGPPYLLM